MQNVKRMFVFVPTVFSLSTCLLPFAIFLFSLDIVLHVPPSGLTFPVWLSSFALFFLVGGGQRPTITSVYVCVVCRGWGLRKSG